MPELIEPLIVINPQQMSRKRRMALTNDAIEIVLALSRTELQVAFSPQTLDLYLPRM